MRIKRAMSMGLAVTVLLLLLVVPSFAAGNCDAPVIYPDGTKIEYCYDELGNLVEKRIILPTRVFNVLRSYQGDEYSQAAGTVTSEPFGIDCSEDFTMNTVVTLTATPDACSYLDNWSGGSCSGGGDCVITVRDDTEITATFNCKPPVIQDFTIEYITQLAPAFVQFTENTADCPTRWLWDFGDGTDRVEKTLPNPMHTYEEEGPYTVTLRVDNCGGADTMSKTDLVRVLPCPNHRVVILGRTSGYRTIVDAYADAVAGDTIRSHARTFIGDHSVGESLILDGGYDCDYTINTGMTIIDGNLIIENGDFAVTVSNYIID